MKRTPSFGSVSDHFKTAAAQVNKDNPGDPIANSFAQYKTLAQLRCSSNIIIPPRKSSLGFEYAGKPKGGVETLQDPTPRNPELVLAKWVDRKGITRTRHKLSEAFKERDDEAPCASSRQLWRELKRAAELLVNKDHIKDYVLLHKSTIGALENYSAGHYRQFLTDILAHKIIASDILTKLSRGPVFKPWMLKQLIFDAVLRSAVDFDKKSADNAIAATAHFIANNGMVRCRRAEIGVHEWKPDGETSLQAYFEQIEDSTSETSIFTLFEQIVLQFGTPANIGASSLEDFICQAALTYAIILQASNRAMEQLVRDSSEHAAKVALDVSVIFAAIGLAAGAAPIPYIASVVGATDAILREVVSYKYAKSVGAVANIASTLHDQFSNYVLKPALAGDRVPGLLEQVDRSELGPTNPLLGGKRKSGGSGEGMGVGVVVRVKKDGNGLTPAMRRRKLGELFRSKYVVVLLLFLPLVISHVFAYLIVH